MQAEALYFKKEDAKLHTVQKQINRRVKRRLAIHIPNRRTGALNLDLFGTDWPGWRATAPPGRPGIQIQ